MEGQVSVRSLDPLQQTLLDTVFQLFPTLGHFVFRSLVREVRCRLVPCVSVKGTRGVTKDLTQLFYRGALRREV